MKPFHVFFLTLLIVPIPAFAQQQSTNDIVTKMQHDLNLSDDQVAKITQVIDRYEMATSDLQKSIADGTINPSDIDSQQQQIKADEDQGVAQYLRPDQLYDWRNIQSQQSQGKDSDEDTGEDDAGQDEYSNLPKNNPPS